MNKVLLFRGLCLAFTLLAVGCNREHPLPEADSPSALLYATKCSICHPPVQPKAHTFVGWKHVVPKMEKNAAAMGIAPLLSEEEKSIIITYLKKHSRVGF